MSVQLHVFRVRCLLHGSYLNLSGLSESCGLFGNEWMKKKMNYWKRYLKVVLEPWTWNIIYFSFTFINLERLRILKNWPQGKYLLEHLLLWLFYAASTWMLLFIFKRTLWGSMVFCVVCTSPSVITFISSVSISWQVLNITVGEYEVIQHDMKVISIWFLRSK